MTRTAALWVPLTGIPLFLVLYVWASCYYPGGSQADAHSLGFSWVNNYWCNLLNSTAINGQPNPAKPIALAAMLILCISLAVFWISFSKIVLTGQGLKLFTMTSGITAMSTAVLLTTSLNHDMVTNLSSLLGLCAVAGTLIGLFRWKWLNLFWFGSVNLLLVLLNNLLYYSPSLIHHLPLVQKISFAFFLAWFFLISWRLKRRQQPTYPYGVS